MYDNSTPPKISPSPFHGSSLLSELSVATIPSTAILLVVLLPLLFPLILRLNKQWQYIVHGRRVLLEGVRKHGSTPFTVPGLLGRITVLPPQYLPELKHAHFSFEEYVEDAYPMTGMSKLFATRSLAMFVHKHLSASLSRYTTDLIDEITFASNHLLTDRTVPAKNTLTHFVARVQCRIFAGPELCRNEKWLGLILNFTSYIGMTGMILRLVPRRMARFVALLIPGYWMAKRAAKEVERMKPEDHQLQLFLSASAIHTTSAALTQFVYDLCLKPEVVEMLREEVKEKGTEDLHKLTKMDSFMKESQRLSPITHVAMQRKTSVDVTMKDGLQLPKHTLVMVASTPVLRSEELYPDPDTFDPLRFYKLRMQEGNENKHQFVSSTDEFFAFSRGPHTCPGRHFASHVLKLSLIHFLNEYDMSFPEGQTQRPTNLEFEENCFPNSKAKVVFTRRKIAS